MVTVHDCLATTPDQVERVKQIMVEAFESAAVTPMIKSTAFDQKAPGCPLIRSEFFGG